MKFHQRQSYNVTRTTITILLRCSLSLDLCFEWRKDWYCSIGLLVFFFFLLFLFSFRWPKKEKQFTFRKKKYICVVIRFEYNTIVAVVWWMMMIAYNNIIWLLNQNRKKIRNFSKMLKYITDLTERSYKELIVNVSS